jgi:hypothetical protein
VELFVDATTAASPQLAYVALPLLAPRRAKMETAKSPPRTTMGMTAATKSLQED